MGLANVKKHVLSATPPNVKARLTPLQQKAGASRQYYREVSEAGFLGLTSTMREEFTLVVVKDGSSKLRKLEITKM